MVAPLRVWVVAPIYCILKLGDEDFEVSVLVSGVKFLDASQIPAAKFQGFPVVSITIIWVILFGVGVPGLVKTLAWCQ